MQSYDPNNRVLIIHLLPTLANSHNNHQYKKQYKVVVKKKKNKEIQKRKKNDKKQRARIFLKKELKIKLKKLQIK